MPEHVLEEWKLRAERAEEELRKCEKLLAEVQAPLADITFRLEEWKRWVHLNGGYVYPPKGKDHA